MTSLDAAPKPVVALIRSRLKTAGQAAVIDPQSSEGKRSQHRRFLAEAGHACGILGESRAPDFGGDLAVEFGAGGAVDRAHSAFAERRGDAAGSDAYWELIVRDFWNGSTLGPAA